MTDNPFLNRAKSRGKTAHGRLSEKRLSKKLGARQTPASGAMIGAKGDMQKQGKLRWLGESKSTVNGSLKLEHHWLTKITKEAMDSSSLPYLTVSFVTAKGLPLPDGEWALVPMWVLKGLEEFNP